MEFSGTVDQEVRDRLKYHFLYRGEVHPMGCAIVGSIMYGEYRDGSDVDLRGIFQWNTDQLLKVKGPPYTRLEYDTKDREGIMVEYVGYGLQRFCQMLVKGNPNIYDQLYSPVQWKEESKHLEELRVIAKRLLTSNIYHPFFGIAKTRWHKITNDPKYWIVVLRNLNRGTAILKGKPWDKSFDMPYDYRDELRTLKENKETVPDNMTHELTLEVERWFINMKVASESSRVQAKIPRKIIMQLDDWLLKIRLETLKNPHNTWDR